MLYKGWPVYLSAVQDILTVCDCLNCCSTDIESNINQYGDSCNSWGSTSNQPPVWWSPDCWLSNEAAEWRRLRWWYVVAGHCYQYTTTMTTLYQPEELTEGTFYLYRSHHFTSHGDYSFSQKLSPQAIQKRRQCRHHHETRQEDQERFHLKMNNFGQLQ